MGLVRTGLILSISTFNRKKKTEKQKGRTNKKKNKHGKIEITKYLDMRRSLYRTLRLYLPDTAVASSAIHLTAESRWKIIA